MSRPATQHKRATYPVYRLSDVAWLGEIPAHWALKRLKHLCLRSALYGANEPAAAYLDGGVRFLRTTDITDQGNLVDEGVHLDPELVRDYILTDGDLLISRSGTIGRAFHYDRSRHGPCAYAGYLVRFVPSSSSIPRFIFYYLKSRPFEHWLSLSVIASTIGNVNGQKYANMPIFQPPLNEQRSIAAFLDRETALIDALIEKKRRQIELLQEKRSALISHAVTKGLDPNAPMKDSGIEWLGEIPEHWEVWKVTHGFHHLGSGTTPKSDDLRYYDGQIPWVTTSELRENVIEDTATKITEDAMRDYSALRLYPPGTLLFAMYGATIGRMGILQIAAAVNQACVAFVKPKEFDTKFVFYWLWMRRPILISLSVGGGQPNLSQEDLKQIRIPCPPIPEQRSIAAFLDRETARIDALIEKVEKSIELLREYRTALISTAVTGKIDVRGEVT